MRNSLYIYVRHNNDEIIKKMGILIELKSGIANNETERVIKHLMKLAWIDDDTKNELILLSSRFNEMDRQKIIGLRENKHELNEINFSLLKIIDRLNLNKNSNSKEDDFYSESIEFQVRLIIPPFGSKSLNCPLDAILSEVIDKIVGEFNVPEKDESGNKINYTLISKGLEKPLNMKQTIWFNGVRRGDILLLIDGRMSD